VIGHHPTIGQVHAFLELDRDHFRIDLHHGSFKPIPNPLIVTIMVTEYFDVIPNFILLFEIRGVRKM
jgi:hypothetical protein